MEAQLLFEIVLEYQTTTYKRLVDKAIKCTYDPTNKKYNWVFRMQDLAEITAILAMPIEFKHAEQDILKAVKLCPAVMQKIPSSRWKGKGEYNFIEKPDIFLCGEWQKDSAGKPKQRFTQIPKECVRDIWQIMLMYPLNKKIKVKTISEHLCRDKGFTKFFKENGNFCWKTFWGLHREGYMRYVYWELKILDSLGLVKYDKTGRACRLKDKLEFQAQYKVSNF